MPLAGEDRVKLQTIQEWVAPDLTALEEEIESLLHGDVPMLEEILAHLAEGKGKRFRPTLVLITARNGDRASAEAVFAAACVELVHTATLVHDDFIDEAATRRGLPTVNARWGASAALITGDYLYSKVFALMTGRDMVEPMKIIARTTHAMSIAEMVQLERKRRLDLSADDYFGVIRKKTASLLEAACEIGALYHPRLSEHRAACAHFGRAVGMAFQIIDDIFDYAGDRRRLGKPVGGDWREGRITLPFIAAWEAAPASHREVLRRDIENGGDPDELWPSVCDFVERYDGIQAAFDAAHRYGSEAKQALEPVTISPQREILSTAADYVLGRLH